MKFRTQYDKRERKYISCAGSPIKATYSPKIVDGVLTLVETGKVNVYEEIQAYKDDCDLKTIYKRFTMGDTTALQRRQAIYGDFSSMPHTLADVHNLLVKGEADFEKLPVDVKQKFGNSFYKFVYMAGTPEWAEMLGITPSPSPVEHNVESEVKSDVNEK